jgi:hypothetical protein
LQQCAKLKLILDINTIDIIPKMLDNIVAMQYNT